MKKYFFFFSFVFLFPFTSFAENFLDVSENHEYFFAIENMKEGGIVKGYQDGTYRPDQKITRAEFLKILLEAQFGDEIKNCNTKAFSDVETAEWYSPYACFAKEKGIVGGYQDGTFRPNASITLSEASKIVVNVVIGKVDQGTGDDWWAPFTSTLQSKESIPASFLLADSTLDISREITRGEMAYMIWQVKAVNPFYKVVSVVDGDTLKVKKGGKTVTVRIIGIDSPEKYTTRTGYEECYGKESSDFASELMNGKWVSLETDESQGEKDKYDRLLAHVSLTNGENFEEKSLKEGFSFWYIYDDVPSKYNDLYETAEKEAKAKNLGVWNVCGGIRKPIEMPSISPLPTVIPTPLPTIVPNPTPSNQTFGACDSKLYCTEMKSCDEAMYFLNTCGLIRLDSDKDGVPCESLCQ